MLTEQTIAPNFTLPDQDNIRHTLSDYKGRTVLVYFYPKDDTPGCTKEACAIRDFYTDFEKEDIQVFGISADNPEKHQKFRKKYDLPFTLLSDTTREIITKYGAAKTPTGIKRISYLIGPDGKILKVYPQVDPASHAMEILEDLKSLKK